MNVTIKKATIPKDLNFIIECELDLEKLYSQPYYKKTTELDIRKKILKYKDDNNYLIIYHKNEPIGLISYNINTAFNKIQINSLYITEPMRNTGIGTTVLKEIEKIAAKNQCHFIRLNVEINNQKGINFYKNNDFKITGYKMEKEITQKG